jgi:hypothetical protein
MTNSLLISTNFYPLLLKTFMRRNYLGFLLIATNGYALVTVVPGSPISMPSPDSIHPVNCSIRASASPASPPAPTFLSWISIEK